jgi:hypothetical protein
MNSSDSCNLNTLDTIELHLIRIESASNEIDAAREPFISGFTLFKSDVTTGLKLCHKSMDILF